MSYSYAMTEGADNPLPRDGHDKHDAEKMTDTLSVESRQFFAEQMEYARGRAEGLRQALRILGREE
jgi:hypothetical protein